MIIQLSISFFVILCFLLGLRLLINVRSDYRKNLNFITEYRSKFIEMNNLYFKNYDKYCKQGEVDQSLYNWLIKNSTKAQAILGYLGMIDYIAPFQTHKVKNFQVVLNIIPKYREQRIEDTFVNILDDCLLRYIGVAEGALVANERSTKNPLVWFKLGFNQVLSLPLTILSTFNIITNTAAERIKSNAVYKILSGFTALMALIASLVTIIQGEGAILGLFHWLIGRK